MFLKAYSNGTYTLPAHISIYCGILPNTNEFIPYYNRFCCSLFRIAFRQVSAKAFCTIPSKDQNIVNGFANMGYNTLLIAAVDWFKHPLLKSPFQEYYYTGIHLEQQLNILLNMIDNGDDKPLFCLLNIGETHDPYCYEGRIIPSLESRARMRAHCREGYIKEDHEKQINSCSYIDDKLSTLFDKLENIGRKTLVVVCGVHGECFGEENLYGHGFYHPKVLEVPLGIFMTKIDN